jgi:DNA-binding transcriptional regulator YiaG
MKASSTKTGGRRGPRRVVRGSPDRLSPGAKILSAIEQATEILRTEGFQSKRLAVRTYKVPTSPLVCQAGDVKRVRQLLGASQAALAEFLGVNVNTVRSWEQGKRLPRPIACRFLSEIESDPAYRRKRIGDE